MPKVVDTLTTLDKILNEKCSLARYGDGELLIMCNKNVNFQNYDFELATRLREILSTETDNLMLGIPNVFVTLDNFENKDKDYWIRNLAMNRRMWSKVTKSNIKYYDAFFSRPYIIYKNKSNSVKYFKMIKLIWNNRNIIIVEGEKSRLGVGNDLFDNAKSIKRIICPSENAYVKYNDILNTVSKQNHEDLILIALGPTATILTFDLHQLGYQAIDIGHLDIEYEWFLRNVQEKVKIEGKYVNEVEDGRNVEELEDKYYINQIIKVI
ncbi:glycosyltransferase [Rhizophagus irregularis]|uniref:Glycosyltransferase n=1 Tax=Rhizophagus irregularis TaxID=588596 RepID=A0A2N0QQQ2_9GLOM|nr:glycosyltransferase [Rhizophagus irregularis]